ncbi:MAG: plastocyanin/azurin family copper-binding protein [Bacteroidota bacterium]
MSVLFHRSPAQRVRFWARCFCIALLATTVAACGGGGDGASAETSGTESVPDGPTIALTLQPVGNTMEFEQKALTVRAGQEVTLTMENTATVDAMVHNIVILNSNDDTVVNRVGMAALQAGEAAGYIPEDAAILAYTPMALPGETTSVTFTAPLEPGEYRYICTYPGHYTLMQGVLTVV